MLGVARLNVGTGLREGVDLCGARPAGHRISGLHESIDCCVLAHHLSKVVARAREGRTDDGNVVFELVRRQSVAELGKIGRASCRERVCQYVEITVVAVSLKKKMI